MCGGHLDVSHNSTGHLVHVIVTVKPIKVGVISRRGAGISVKGPNQTPFSSDVTTHYPLDPITLSCAFIEINAPYLQIAISNQYYVEIVSHN